jgi:hypothetical protein
VLIISTVFRQVAAIVGLSMAMLVAGCDEREDFKGFAKLGEGVYVSKVATFTDRQLTATTILRTVEIHMIDQTVPGGKARFLTIRLECQTGKYYIAQGFDYGDKAMKGDHSPVSGESASALRLPEPGSPIALVVAYAQASDVSCLKG